MKEIERIISGQTAADQLDSRTQLWHPAKGKDAAVEKFKEWGAEEVIETKDPISGAKHTFMVRYQAAWYYAHTDGHSAFLDLGTPYHAKNAVIALTMRQQASVAQDIKALKARLRQAFAEEDRLRFLMAEQITEALKAQQ